MPEAASDFAMAIENVAVQLSARAVEMDKRLESQEPGRMRAGSDGARHGKEEGDGRGRPDSTG